MSNNMSVNVSITYMQRVHMPDVREIEEASFGDPWLPEVITHSIRRKDTTGVVAIVNEEVAGYAIYQLVQEDGEAVLRVARLAVAEWCRFCGVGGVLLDDLIGRLTLVRDKLVFPVRESNLIAQVWLREYGLQCEEIRDDWFGDGESAYVFTRYFGGEL